MHVAVETIVEKIKQETAKVERALENGSSKEVIREHARLIRAFSELIEGESGTASDKTEEPVVSKEVRTQRKSPAAVYREQERHEVPAKVICWNFN